MSEPYRLVVLGGGVAGLDIASHVAGKAVNGRPLSVTLIDRESAHVWKPMLHTIAAGTQQAVAQQIPYVAQASDRGFVYEPGEAIRIDRNACRVELAALTVGSEAVLPARGISYDSLVIAVGSRANDFGTPGVADHCATIDSRSEAIAFNDRLRITLLKALAARKILSIAIVGGGATGVELAAELIQVTELTEHLGATGARDLVRVTLLEAGDRLLGGFPASVSQATREKLTQLGIVVKTSAKVASVDEGGFDLDGGGRISADLKVWAAGVKAPDVLRTIEGLERSHSGQLVVGPTLSAPGDPRVFAVGDCAAPRLTGRDVPVPTTAQAAHQEALYLCSHLLSLLEGHTAPDFRYHDFGALVSLGGYDAYGSLGRFGFFKGGFIRGRVAQLGHAMLYRSHQARLHGFWRGGLLWLADTIAARARPAARLA